MENNKDELGKDFEDWLDIVIATMPLPKEEQLYGKK